MQTDPIGYADGMNMYAYVKNDPVNATDPTGLEINWDVQLEGGAGAGPTITVTGRDGCGLFCTSYSDYYSIRSIIDSLSSLPKFNTDEIQADIVVTGKRLSKSKTAPPQKTEQKKDPIITPEGVEKVCKAILGPFGIGGGASLLGDKIGKGTVSGIQRAIDRGKPVVGRVLRGARGAAAGAEGGPLGAVAGFVLGAGAGEAIDYFFPNLCSNIAGTGG